MGDGEDKGVVVGRVLPTQIPTSIPMKPITSIAAATTTTMNDPQANVDWSKLQKKKISIGEGGSSKEVTNQESASVPKDKGKGKTC